MRVGQLYDSSYQNNVRGERNVKPVVAVDTNSLVNREVDRVLSASYSTTYVRLSQIYRLIRRSIQFHAYGDVCCASVARGVIARGPHHSLSSSAEEPLPRRDDLDCHVKTPGVVTTCCRVETRDYNRYVERSCVGNGSYGYNYDRNGRYAENELPLGLPFCGSRHVFFKSRPASRVLVFVTMPRINELLK
jgi:hypothetical protein